MRKPKVFDDTPYEDLTEDQRERMLQHARNSCLWSLNRRSYSEKQIRDKLERKNLPNEIINQVVTELFSEGWLNDEKYAEQFVYSAITYKGAGRGVIRMDLKRAGIDEDLIVSLLDDYDTETEEAGAAKLAAKSLNSSRGLERQKRITRAVSMLARKGYSPSMAFSVVNQALAEEQEEYYEDE